MNRSRMLQRVLAGKFSPLELFSNGEQGAWYDPSDLSTLFQDDAGTTPVTADGQPVGLMLDKSGNGNHASQSGTARPLYKTDGSLHWLEHSGQNHFLLLPIATAGAVSSSNTASLGLRLVSGTTSNPYAIGGNNDDGFLMLYRSDTGNIRPAVTTDDGIITLQGTTNFNDTNHIYSQEWNRPEGKLSGWGNSVLETQGTGTPSDKSIPNNLALGGRGSGTPRWNGNIYGGTIIDRVLSDGERNKLEKYLADKTGITL